MPINLITTLIYFFENEVGAAVSINGLRYPTMINELLWSELVDMGADDVYFPQDGATYDTSCEITGLLREKFPGRVIHRNGDYNWPILLCVTIHYFHISIIWIIITSCINYIYVQII